MEWGGERGEIVNHVRASKCDEEEARVALNAPDLSIGGAGGGGDSNQPRQV